MKPIEFVIKGETPSKKNKWHISRNGGMYLDKSVKEWNDEAAWRLKPMVREFGMLTQNLAITCKFQIKRDKDLDNMLSSIFDVLQYIGLIKNDKQFSKVFAEKLIDKEKQCALVSIRSL